MTVESILKFYPQFIDSDYVFKSCQGAWIVVLEKLSDTLTNETRDNIVEKQYAKYRADKLKVIMIFNKHNPSQTKKEVVNSFYKNLEIIYKVGEIVHSDSFDSNLNNVCTSGIHYFLNIEPAYYLECEYWGCFTGKYIQWYDNGQKRQESYRFKGHLHDKYIRWHINGQKDVECEFIDGIHHGKFIRWYPDGQLSEECQMVNGTKDGKYISWYENGRKRTECTYVNGMRKDTKNYP